MSDEHVTVERGRRAKALLENELIEEAFTELDRRIWDAFKAANPRDMEALQYTRRLVQTVRDFRKYFEDIVSHGEDAEARIKDRERRGLLKLTG